jgi:ADP-ribosylglycohydrolase
MTDRARYRGALLGLLVGDVLGAPFEGHVGTVSEPEFTEVASASTPLRYTDDTAMAITLAESLLRCGGIDDDDLGQSFAHHWALAPERGYSSTTATLLAWVHAGAHGPNRPPRGDEPPTVPPCVWLLSPCTPLLNLPPRSPWPGAVHGSPIPTPSPKPSPVCRARRSPPRSADGLPDRSSRFSDAAARQGEQPGVTAALVSIGQLAGGPVGCRHRPSHISSHNQLGMACHSPSPTGPTSLLSDMVRNYPGPAGR